MEAAEISEIGKAMRWMSGYGVPLLSQLPDEPKDGEPRPWVVDIHVAAKSFADCGRPDWYFESFRGQEGKPDLWSERGWRVRCIAPTPEQAAAAAVERVKAISEGPHGHFMAAECIEAMALPAAS